MASIAVTECTCALCNSTKAAFATWEGPPTSAQARGERALHRALSMALDRLISTIVRNLEAMQRRGRTLVMGRQPVTIKWGPTEEQWLTEAIRQYIADIIGPGGEIYNDEIRMRDVRDWLDSEAILPHHLRTQFDTGVAVGMRLLAGADMEYSARVDAASDFMTRAFLRLSATGFRCIGNVLHLRMPDYDIMQWIETGEGAAPGLTVLFRYAIEQGMSPLELARLCRKVAINYEKWEYQRLARTETAFALTAGQVAAFEDAGFAAVPQLAVNNLPPIHPNCLCGVELDVVNNFWVLSPSLLACQLCLDAKREEQLAVARFIRAAPVDPVVEQGTQWAEHLPPGPDFEEKNRALWHWWNANVTGHPTPGVEGEDRAIELKKWVDKQLRERLSGDPDWQKFEKWYANSTYFFSFKGNSSVASLIHQWAFSSGDARTMSIALQLAAAEEFRLTGISTAHYPRLHVRRAQEILRENGAALRKFLRAQYELTQEMLSKAGITHFALYRGTAVPGGLVNLAKQGRAIQEVSLAPLSSFAINHNIAQYFAADNHSPGKDEYGCVVWAQIPAQRILSLPVTGMGCWGETEFVVLGGPGKVHVEPFKPQA